MRLFFAVPLDQRLREIVWDSIMESPIGDPPWRWIRPENYHLTLKFLGEVDEEFLPALRSAGEETASAVRKFRVTFGDFGGFPNLRRPRVIFYSINDGFEELRALARGIEDSCETIGFERERKKFRAHLTLARIKKSLSPGLLERLSEMPGLPASAGQGIDSIVLMKSRLERTGAVYEEIGRFPLKP
jgi:2'-5' RNA ligase